MKFLMVAAFGAGYVLGSRAGRQRYEDIRATASRVREDPRVQDAAARSTWPEHPDAHVEVPEDEVVHTSGPKGG